MKDPLVNAITWSWQRFRPSEGWLALSIFVALVISLIAQVTTVRWVPEIHIIWFSLLGLLLAYILAVRPVAGWLAWIILSAYGLIVSVIWLGHLWPPLSTVLDGWGAISFYFRENWSLFLARLDEWLTATFSGNSSQETIFFALFLSLLAWFLVAFATWSIFRQRRPLTAITLLILGLAVNSYFGRALLTPAVLFVGLGIVFITVFSHTELERQWSLNRVDYSTEIRWDLLTYGAVLALFLFTFAFLAPSLNIRALYNLFFDRPAVHQLEERLDQAFAGVRVPSSPNAGAGSGEGPGRGQPGNQLPRSFLLGGAPELYETVVMTATVFSDPPTPAHWRGASYDIYTGRGWLVSEERQEIIDRGDPIPLPEYTDQAPLTQKVGWLQGELRARFTIGFPQVFDHDVLTYWHGSSDLSRVRGDGNRYIAVSLVSTANPLELRQARLDLVPPDIIDRYTALPETVPTRVADLARQVVSNLTSQTPYDQAKALERFLRQYPYSLEVELPPGEADPVDYFLFELQSGYCDYYASAMVVMARSIGLPARLATGYLAQPAGEDDEQAIRQIDAHSWAEIYFAGYGWIEFEPTAAFPASGAGRPGQEETSPGDLPLGADRVPPIPTAPTRGISIWWALLPVVIILGAAVLFLYRSRNRIPSKEGVLWAYAGLQQYARRIGEPMLPSQTPTEFQGALMNHLQQLDDKPFVTRVNFPQLRPEIEQVTTDFIAKQYSRKEPSPTRSVESWRRIRGRLWWLSIQERISRLLVKITTPFQDH